MSGIRTSLLSREVIPFYAALVALGIATVAVDAGLHLANAVWIGRYLGIAGVLMILASFGYSLRKRKWITSGKPVQLLRWHERLAWAGSLLILVHAGIHFNAILAWLAVAAMLVNVASGLTGKYLLARSQRRLAANRATLLAKELLPEAVEEQMYWDSLTFGAVKAWRAVHRPITLAFGVMALAHIVAVCLFWGWK
jgi:hypothetical protein